MSLAELLQQLDGEIAARVARAAADTRQQLLERLQRAHEEVTRALAEAAPATPGGFLPAEQLAELTASAQQGGREEGYEEGRATALSALRDGLRRLDRAASQAEVLRALLDAARSFGSRAARFLTPASGVRGWGASGFGGGLRSIDELTFETTSESPWTDFATGKGTLELTAGESARIVSDLDPALPLAGALIPLVLRDQVAAALYVDRLETGDRLDLPALQVLAFCAAQAIELLAFRERRATPTLHLANEPGAEEAGLALWQAAVAAPELEIEEEAPAAPVTPVPVAAPFAEPSLGEAEFELGSDVESIPLAELPEPAASAAAATPAVPDLWAVAAEPFVETEETEATRPPRRPAAETEAWPVAEEESMWEVEAETPAAPPAPSFAPAASAAPPPVAAPAPLPIEAPAPAAWEMEPAPVEDLSAFAPPTLAAPSWEVPAPTPAAPAPTPPPMVAPTPAVPPLAAVEPPRAPAPALVPPPRPAPFAVPDVSEDETVALTKSTPFAPQPVPAVSPFATTAAPEAVPPPRPVVPAADEPAKFAARGAEVVPPADLSGPGWAFSTTRIPVAATGDEALHEEARRLARLLVSEIKLYNEEQVEEGRRNRDVYHRLRDDIDRSRQLYEERVAERIRATTDYFYQELVRNLAGGDARTLGM